jgi:hypothetical protein
LSCVLCPDRITTPNYGEVLVCRRSIKEGSYNEGKACEKHFVENTRRLESGQYEFRLPMKSGPKPLGESYEFAKSKLLKLDKRLPQISGSY